MTSLLTPHVPGGYGKLIGAGSPGMSSHRYSPYSLPSFNSGAAMAAGLAGHPGLVQQSQSGVPQYTMSSPLMSQSSSSQSQGPGNQAIPTLESQPQGRTWSISNMSMNQVFALQLK